MAEFRVERTPDPTFPPGTGHQVVRLEGPECRAEVWPGRGFNPLRWQVRAPGVPGWQDVFYVAPDWEANPVPTRSGQPVLFPFPNRLRFGRFDFGGATYQLPLTESTKTHAIHGFAPRTPWQVVSMDAGDGFAFVTGELSLSRDLPGLLAHWPADFTLRITYTLRPAGLEVLAELHNPDGRPLPFGLGYHGYFRWPHPDAGAIDELVLEADTGRFWTAENSLATGESVPVTPVLDWRSPRRWAARCWTPVPPGRRLRGQAAGDPRALAAAGAADGLGGPGVPRGLDLHAAAPPRRWRSSRTPAPPTRPTCRGPGSMRAGANSPLGGASGAWYATSGRARGLLCRRTRTKVWLPRRPTRAGGRGATEGLAHAAVWSDHAKPFQAGGGGRDAPHPPERRRA